MRKMKLYGYKLYLVRLAFCTLALFLGMVLLSFVLLCLANPLPFVTPCTLILFFASAMVFGVLSNREEKIWFSALPSLTLALLLVVASLIVRGGRVSLLTVLYAVLFVGFFLLGRVLPRKRRKRHARFS